MCIFSGSVESVSGTKIFCRATDAVRQCIVYSMQYEAAAELAMVLPLPVPHGSAEDCVAFVDLSGYSDFFDDLDAGFPQDRSKHMLTDEICDNAPRSATLVVHEVGDFEASFVPSVQAFDRLDARFRLPPNTWERLPRYGDWGFAVFKLKAGAKAVSPMALTFPRRDASSLYFPTTHIHDGEVHQEAEFDHALYCQEPGVAAKSPNGDWECSHEAASQFANVDASRGLIAANQRVLRLKMHGMHRNEDVYCPPRPPVASSSGCVAM